ncbi:hypothetical protein [Actinomycetospora soli]|uniref:hypothetical protein n=1 Tax=Actinomycetospora soli TaxID=2893887 RepID=UPI001E41D626|nr:hypothetical protein [Actinomycetospora soli]MCD2191150.1 hypothetical protein [Actinomycetospora soli]
MTGAVVLFLVGVLFLGVAARGCWARRTGAVPTPGRLTSGVDVLVGTVALADAASSVADHPARLLLWSGGSAVLVVACALLVVHTRRSNRHL